MSRLIDADALEKDGWMMHRTVRVNKDTMSYQTKKPTDFPTIETRKKGRWYDVGSLSCRCSKCGCKSQKESSFCPNCGADMREGGGE